MIKAALATGFTLVFAAVVLAAPAKPAAQHDREFWRSIAKEHYAVPAEESADALAHELSSLLASPDSELRDDLAYSILAHWIYRENILSKSALVALTDEWRANIKNVPAKDFAD